jgi:hypothetical protein
MLSYALNTLNNIAQCWHFPYYSWLRAVAVGVSAMVVALAFDLVVVMGRVCLDEAPVSLCLGQFSANRLEASVFPKPNNH